MCLGTACLGVAVTLFYIMVAGVADMAIAALSDVLETNDKQHLSITILLNDNQQLQDKLDAIEAELSNVRMEKHTALEACAASELLLAESQARPDTQMVLCTALILIGSCVVQVTVCWRCRRQQSKLVLGSLGCRHVQMLLLKRQLLQKPSWQGRP